MQWKVMDHRLEVDWVGNGYRATLWYALPFADPPVLWVSKTRSPGRAALKASNKDAAARVSPSETAWSQSQSDRSECARLPLPACAIAAAWPSPRRSPHWDRYSRSRIPRHHRRAKYSGVDRRHAVE